MSKDREFIQLNHKEMLLLKNLLDLKQRHCYYCKEPLDFRKKFGIFNKPDRIICNNILCLTEAIN